MKAILWIAADRLIAAQMTLQVVQLEKEGLKRERRHKIDKGEVPNEREEEEVVIDGKRGTY